MILEKRIKAFENLSNYLLNLFVDEDNTDFKIGNKIFDAIVLSTENNRWFTKENIKYAILTISNSISKDNINEWLKKYNSLLESNSKCLNVGIIMAGNIPLVGFNDFFYVLMSGNCVKAKLSSDDKYLLPALAEKLIEIEPEFKEYIFFVENLKSGFDAVIATGSNNSSRYFDYYFGKYPNIIRKNRNSIAILTGKETNQELSDLGKDIFTYYGLGCRNVSKVFIPENYYLDRLLHQLSAYKDVITNNKYCNNYNYHKSIFMINQLPFYNIGFSIFKEDEALSSPISVVNFEYYRTIEQIETFLNNNKEKIQCVISNGINIKNILPFGAAQRPGLSDYADEIDVMEFLINL